MHSSLQNLFGIKYPIISGGMVWCSGWRLASAVSLCGGLGLIGAGSMHPETLSEHIKKTKQVLNSIPFGVNIPLLYPSIEEIIKIVIDEEVPIVFTSAGNPRTWTSMLKNNGIKVVHVVSSSIFAKKSEDAGVDAVVAEGFEAGGHNGKEETTTLALIPEVRKAITIPLIAAGGIASGEALMACLALGADGVQIGSLFASTIESSAHINFKELITKSQEGDTMLALKKIGATRFIKNSFYEEVKKLEDSGASKEDLATLLGKGRSKKGIFLGDIIDGELEIGQVSSQISSIDSVSVVFERLLREWGNCHLRIANSKSF